MNDYPSCGDELCRIVVDHKPGIPGCPARPAPIGGGQMTPADRQRIDSWLLSVRERAGTDDTDRLIAAHYVPIMLAGLDERDALLRRVLPAFENDQAKAEAEGLEHPDSYALLEEIRALLGEEGPK